MTRNAATRRRARAETVDVAPHAARPEAPDAIDVQAATPEAVARAPRRPRRKAEPLTLTAPDSDLAEAVAIDPAPAPEATPTISEPVFDFAPIADGGLTPPAPPASHPENDDAGLQIAAIGHGPRASAEDARRRRRTLAMTAVALGCAGAGALGLAQAIGPHAPFRTAASAPAARPAPRPLAPVAVAEEARPIRVEYRAPDHEEVSRAYVNVAAVYRSEGLSGVVRRTMDCFEGLKSEPSYGVLDYCVALDLFGAALRRKVAGDAALAPDSWFAGSPARDLAAAREVVGAEGDSGARVLDVRRLAADVSTAGFKAAQAEVRRASVANSVMAERASEEQARRHAEEQAALDLRQKAAELARERAARLAAKAQAGAPQSGPLFGPQSGPQFRPQSGPQSGPQTTLAAAPTVPPASAGVRASLARPSPRPASPAVVAKAAAPPASRPAAVAHAALPAPQRTVLAKVQAARTPAPHAPAHHAAVVVASRHVPATGRLLAKARTSPGQTLPGQTLRAHAHPQGSHGALAQASTKHPPRERAAVIRAVAHPPSTHARAAHRTLARVETPRQAPRHRGGARPVLTRVAVNHGPGHKPSRQATAQAERAAHQRELALAAARESQSRSAVRPLQVLDRFFQRVIHRTPAKAETRVEPANWIDCRHPRGAQDSRFCGASDSGDGTLGGQARRANHDGARSVEDGW